MKIVTKRKIRVIHEKSGSAFERKYNEAMDELAKYDPEVEFNHSKGFCAYLVYAEDEKIPESLIDRCELSGIKYTCSDCPHLKQTADKRRKWFYCEYDERTHYISGSACDKLYREKIEDGEISESIVDEEANPQGTPKGSDFDSKRG